MGYNGAGLRMPRMAWAPFRPVVPQLDQGCEPARAENNLSRGGGRTTSGSGFQS
jgi:hypothetical protein